MRCIVAAGLLQSFTNKRHMHACVALWLQGCCRACTGGEAAAAVPGGQLWRARGAGNGSQGAAAGGLARPRRPIAGVHWDEGQGAAASGWVKPHLYLPQVC